VRPGWERQVVSSEFGALGRRTQHSSWEMWADSAHGESTGYTEQELRGGLETIRGEPCLREHVTFDIAGNRFRLSV